ncbi:hypothetical protein FEP76_06052 [Burkholderia multivorans]|nr:hypothetical protein [Burkholderia multivorans]
MRIVHLAREMDTVAHTEFDGQLLEFCAVRTVARQNEMLAHVIALEELRIRAQQGAMVFL